MAQATEMALLEAQAVARPSEAPAEDRWPLHHTILFVVISSTFLWSLIISAVRWLIG